MLAQNNSRIGRYSVPQAGGEDEVPISLDKTGPLVSVVVRFLELFFILFLGFDELFALLF